jgi:hypothetical protein
MKKSLTLIIITFVIIGGAFFFYPKTKATGGFLMVMPTESAPTPKCLGFMKVENVPDATLLTCYGVFY